ncbi:MAG: hypothetical protein LBC82_05025 [Oscillospiraceae bacterium]|jgi:hypothetical protein|nr:hypothetical protein [Oscillospiraceae bacterium]
MSNVEWLWINSIDFDSSAQSILQKLSSHGYAIALNRMEGGKLQTTELCVHDVLTQKENPNIVIIAPEHLVKNWYFSLLWDLGVEFKNLGVYEKSLDLYSPSISNCCLVSAEGLLRAEKNSALSQAGSAGIIWDLMVIDLPLTGGADLQDYIKSIKTKTKKLLINTPASEGYGKKLEKLSEAVKALLHRNRKEDKGAEYPVLLSEPDGHVVAGRNMTGDYNIKTINYKTDGALYAKAERIDDTRSGIPLYSYGGNIFEEYNLKDRKTYLREGYDKKELKVLVTADGKLEAFLKEIVTLLSDPGNRIVVYCTLENTMKYVSKALWACNGGKKGICVYDKNTTDAEFVSGEMSGAGSEEPHIIVTDDSAGSRFLNIEKITHIINYEYPENPAVLEQRLTRAGRKPSSGSPAFYIFCDEDYKFDGRMLRKTVLSNLGDTFCRVPDKSLLFDIDNIEEHLIVLILDLKYLSDNAKDDVIESFRVEYNAPEAVTAAGVAGTARKRLKSLVDMFGLHEVMKQKEVDGERLFMEVSEKIEKFRGKRVCLDEKGVLNLAGKTKLPAETKTPPEATKAAEFTKKLTGRREDFTLIKAETEKLSYSLKFSALVNIWKHYKFELKIQKSYKGFIEAFNFHDKHDKGVI